MLRRPPRSPRFPYTTLFRSVLSRANGMRELRQPCLQPIDGRVFERAQIRRQLAAERVVPLAELGAELEQPRQAVGTLEAGPSVRAQVGDFGGDVVRRQRLLQGLARPPRERGRV